MILKNHIRQDLYLIDEDKTLFCLNIFVQMQEKIVIFLPELAKLKNVIIK
jgi:hypothetical protein